MRRTWRLWAWRLLGGLVVVGFACGCSSSVQRVPASRETVLPRPPTPEERRVEEELIQKQGRLGRQLMETFTVEQLRKANAAALSHPDDPRPDPATHVKFQQLTPEQQQILREYYDVSLALWTVQETSSPSAAPPDIVRAEREAFFTPVEETELYTIGYIWDQGGPDWQPFLDYSGYWRRRGKNVGMFGCGHIRGGVEPTAAMKEAGINFRDYPLMQHWEGSAAEAHYDPSCGEGSYRQTSR